MLSHCCLCCSSFVISSDTNMCQPQPGNVQSEGALHGMLCCALHAMPDDLTQCLWCLLGSIIELRRQCKGLLL